jgi:hypothetical protein
MPSPEHAALVELFRDDPDLALVLLRAASVSLEARSLQPLESTFPIVVADYHVDLVLASKEASEVRFVVLVEVQLRKDANKAFSWPLYQAAARARHKCDCCLLVLTLDDEVARWAAQPIVLGPAGPVFQPIVLGPGAVPVPTDGASAELWVLGAIAHGRADDTIVDGALLSLGRERPDHTGAFLDLLRYHLGDAFERALEKIMATNEHKYLSDYARKYFDEGEAKGKAEGKAEGKVEGLAEGQARALLHVLAARGIQVGDDLRARVLSCSDLAQLDAWLQRAVRATRVDEVFDG